MKTEEGFEVPVKSVIWYDRYTRSWVLQHLDKFGNQCGQAEYSAQRPEGFGKSKEREYKEPK